MVIADALAQLIQQARRAQRRKRGTMAHGRTSIDTEYLYSVRLEVKRWRGAPTIEVSNLSCNGQVILRKLND
jgi:hypothetical protein